VEIGLVEAGRAAAAAGEGDGQLPGLVDGDAVGLVEGLAVLVGAVNGENEGALLGRPRCDEHDASGGSGEHRRNQLPLEAAYQLAERRWCHL
jgi:hypothetical protein